MRYKEHLMVYIQRNKCSHKLWCCATEEVRACLDS